MRLTKESKERLWALAKQEIENAVSDALALGLPPTEIKAVVEQRLEAHGAV